MSVIFKPETIVIKYLITPLKKNPKIFWLTAIVVLSTILRLAFIHEPFERDEGQYAAIAQEILRGGLPYRDAIEIKPPGTFYLYALAIGLFGATTEAIRLFTAAYSAMTVVAVYGVARQSDGWRAGLWAALVYGIFSTFPMLSGSSSNTEVFLVLPMTAGVWFLLKSLETKKRSYLYGVGLCCATSMIIKPVALPMVVLEFLLILFLRSGKNRIRETVLDLASFILPVAICTVAIITYYYLRSGLDDLLYWTVEFPFHYKESEIKGPTLGGALGYLNSAILAPALLGIVSALWFLWKKRNIEGCLPFLLILAASLSIALPGKNFLHYFVIIIPFLSIPAGIGLANIPSMKMIPACMAALIVFTLISFSVFKNYKFYTIYSPETVSLLKYGSDDFVKSAEVAQYLRKHTLQDDYIFQWGGAPELYFLSNRRCPNPFLINISIGWSKDPQQAVNTMITSLFHNKPSYIVYQSSWMGFKGKNELLSYINAKCMFESRIGDFYIHRCSKK